MTNGENGVREPQILEIKGNSLDDGPGIRSVVFFKGCPLSCAWCHNPESKRPEPELSFDERECIACDACVKQCPRGALSRSTPGYVDRSRCDRCFRCVQACPAEALTRVGKPMAVAEVVERVLRDKPFFLNSGGGVTLSGGEPALFPDYAGELLAELKAAGVHTLVETCGHFRMERFLETLYPHTDQIYMDLKLDDDAEHRRLCGAGNERIKANFRELQERAASGGVPILARIPLIPEMTATDDNLKALASFIRGTGARMVALLAYNPLWPEKSARLGEADPVAGRDRLHRWMQPDELERCRSFFDGLEIVR